MTFLTLLPGHYHHEKKNIPSEDHLRYFLYSWLEQQAEWKIHEYKGTKTNHIHEQKMK